MFLLLDRYDVKGDGGVIVPTRFKEEFALGKFYFFDECVYWFLSISLTLYRVCFYRTGRSCCHSIKSQQYNYYDKTRGLVVVSFGFFDEAV
jgi:hypothetical protein